jgi:7,8-dihydropterin-6-yl-methyl-4-(beta-D-ribofuranosyl)aminobenzene 5'-phosphate synthase
LSACLSSFFFKKKEAESRTYLQDIYLVKKKGIWDDRAIVISVKHKGLVIVSGCAHAGIINTVLYAQQLTKTETVHAILGGFHLAGKNEPNISQTVEELKKINPKLVAPSHCTGWRGLCAIAKAMPDAFVLNSVGNLYTF